MHDTLWLEFSSLGLDARFGIQEDTFLYLSFALAARYQDVPFHNFRTAAQVRRFG